MASRRLYSFQTLIKRHKSSIQATDVTDFMCNVYVKILQPTSDIKEIDPGIYDGFI